MWNERIRWGYEAELPQGEVEWKNDPDMLSILPEANTGMGGGAVDHIKRKQLSVPEYRVPKRDADGRSYGTGRRKRAVARVWVSRGDGIVSVNKRLLPEYFSSTLSRSLILQPLVATENLDKMNVMATVQGGGIRAQAGAVCLGIARALQAFDPAMRPPLKARGLLKRDPREVERKKPGRKKARRAFQWVKR